MESVPGPDTTNGQQENTQLEYALESQSSPIFIHFICREASPRVASNPSQAAAK